jgi:hypothetical protein
MTRRGGSWSGSNGGRNDNGDSRAWRERFDGKREMLRDEVAKEKSVVLDSPRRKGTAMPPRQKLATRTATRNAGESKR